MENPIKTPAVAIGLLTALVSHELVSCEDMMQESGWTACEPPFILHRAGIAQWEKSIAGVNVTAYTGAIGSMGQTNSAVETFSFISRVSQYCGLNAIILCGIAGGLLDWVKKKDVVAALNVHWRVQTRISSGSPCDTYRVSDSTVSEDDPDEKMFVQRFVERSFPENKRGKEYSVICGDVFTWDYVVDSKAVTDELNQKFSSCVCVEMEAAGFLKAIRRYNMVHRPHHIAPYIVRGISDDARKKDYDVPTREIASRNAAKVALVLAEEAIKRMLYA